MEVRSPEQFLQDYGLGPSDLDIAGISWADLLEIRDDFRGKIAEYDAAGIGVLRSLLRYGVIHAMKYRIKDPDHLMAKIVRCRIRDASQVITVTNYESVISDLIGIRILHLIKSHWYEIHEIIRTHYRQAEAPVANVRAGDPEQLIRIYADRGCAVRLHPQGYRSVHYLIHTESGSRSYRVEIQVRTIFEESWGEVDHAVRYPRLTSDPLMQEFLEILSRLAGSADETAEFILGWKEEVLVRGRLSAKLAGAAAGCMEELRRSSLSPAEKESLFQGLQDLLSLIPAVGKPPLLTSIYLPDKDEQA